MSPSWQRRVCEGEHETNKCCQRCCWCVWFAIVLCNVSECSSCSSCCCGWSPCIFWSPVLANRKLPPLPARYFVTQNFISAFDLQTCYLLKRGSCMPRCTLHTGAAAFTTYLSGFGRGLDKRDSVAAGQLLRLPRLHHAGPEVALIPHQHHGNTVTVLHPVDLLSEERTHTTAPKRWRPPYFLNRGLRSLDQLPSWPEWESADTILFSTALCIWISSKVKTLFECKNDLTELIIWNL